MAATIETGTLDASFKRNYADGDENTTSQGTEQRTAVNKPKKADNKIKEIFTKHKTIILVAGVLVVGTIVYMKFFRKRSVLEV
jgi:hypothetical protein